VPETRDIKGAVLDSPHYTIYLLLSLMAFVPF